MEDPLSEAGFFYALVKMALILRGRRLCTNEAGRRGGSVRPDGVEDIQHPAGSEVGGDVPECLDDHDAFAHIT